MTILVRMDITKIIHTAKEFFLEYKRCPQIIFAETIYHAQVVVCLADMPQTETLDKQMYLFMQGRYLAEVLRDADMIQLCFLTEAWQSIDDGSNMERKEIILLSVLDIIQRKLSNTLYKLEILRIGEAVDLLPIDDSGMRYNDKMLQAFLAGYVSNKISDAEMENIVKEILPE